MVGEILAGLGAFKTMVDLAKRIKDVNDASTRNAIAIELQEKILSAQAEQTALIQEMATLKKHVADLEAWDADKQRYELKEIATGQFSFVLKPETNSGEPSHMLCANCYNQNQKSILQKELRSPGAHEVLFCQNCGSEMFSPVTGGRSEAHSAVKKGGTWNKARKRQ